jgi:hypothetical protein
MEKKIRIQLFTPEGILYSDRLVEQDPELAKGPKEISPGAMRVEFTMLDSSDIEPACNYLKALAGIIPIESVVKKVKKVNTVVDIDNREDFLNTVIEEHKQTDQDQLIKFLRGNDFVFLMSDHLESMELPINLKQAHKENYQWMIRIIKRAKNPKNDKYDPMLVFGISLIGDRTDKVIVYLNGEHHSVFKSPVPTKPRETFKKSGMVKFPHYMELDERERFRIEYRALLDNPGKEPSKFFNRWKPYVENLPDNLAKVDKK